MKPPEDAPLSYRPDSAPETKRIENIVGLTRDRLPLEVEDARRSTERVFGKYVLLNELGRGGTGYVRRAWDTMLAQYVALKFIHLQQLGNAGRGAEAEQEERIRGLIQEARVASRFHHPNIVPVHDVGQIGEQYYVSMRFIEGASLHDHINASRARGWVSPLYEEPAHFLGLLRDISGAIEYAHTFRPPVIHCDLKPSNILLDSTKTGYVVDFGLARVVEAGEDEDIGVRGTPAYMAPEQLRGKASELGVFTDIYGLGTLLYIMLSGAPPFRGDPVQVIEIVGTRPPVRPSVLVRAQRKPAERMWASPILPNLYHLEEICLRCLAMRPEDRYRSAQQVAQELQGVLDLVGGSGRSMEARREELADASPTSPESAEAVTAFRARLAQRVNSLRPSVADFTLQAVPGGTIQLLRATPAGVYVLRRGVIQVLDWADLPCGQAISLAQTAGLGEPGDRLALGILAMRDGLTEESTRLFESLKGTPLEDTSRRIRAGGGGADPLDFKT